jgi:hypothetical protein
MPQSSQVFVKDAPGLQTQPSPLTLPPGSVLESFDADILRDGVYQLRRGFDFYGEQLDEVVSQILQYRLRLLLHVDDELFYDSDGAGTDWTQITGTYESPDASTRIRFVEASENLYLTTADGPVVLDALDGTPRRAGMPQGLDLNPELSGTGGGWMLGDTQVGYKAVFVHVDGNKNEIPGAASYRETVANPAPEEVALTFGGGTVTVTQVAHGYTTGDEIEIAEASDAAYEEGPHTITVVDPDTYTYTVVGAPASPGTAMASKSSEVTLSITLPDQVAAGDFLELYRTEQSASDDDDPGDRHLLVKRQEITSSDVSTGIITFVDSLDEELLGIQLESNPTANGPSQTPDRPPWARYVQLWQGHLWYAHTRQAHNLKLQLLDVVGLVDDTAAITLHVDITQTYTFSTAENQGARKFKRWTTESTTAANIRKTMRSFVKIVNRDATSAVEAFYISGPTDAPGIVLLRRKALNVDAFWVTADSSGTGDNFTPTIPTSGEDVISDEDYRQNGIYNSRAGRPEAVPFANAWRAGSDLDEIRGLLATSSALLVFTAGGAYKITGESDGGAGKTFGLDELDLAVILEAPETLVKLDDHAFGYFNQGVMRISALGSGIVSEGKIGSDLLTISRFNAFNTIAHGAAYESDHKYLLFTQAGNGDITAQYVWVYNYLGNRWTGPWRRPSSASLVLKGKDLLYLARSDTPVVVEERRSYARSGADYRDETYGGTVTDFDETEALSPWEGTVSRVTVDYDGFDDLTAGWRFRQGFNHGRVCAVEDLGGGIFRLTLDQVLNDLDLDDCELWRPIEMQLRYRFDGGNAAILKQATDVQAYFEDRQPSVFDFGFQSDMQFAVEWRRDYLNPRGGGGWGFNWGFDWGSTHTGHSEPAREKVPRNHQRHRCLDLILRHKTAGEACTLLQVTEDVRTISSVTHRR